MKKPEYKILYEDLPRGDAGIYITVREMIRLAQRDSTSEVVRGIAGKIGRECAKMPAGEKREFCEISSAFRYVVDTVTYKLDPKRFEHITAPMYLLTSHTKGDCDCMSAALSSILTALGYENGIRIIDWKTDGSGYSHVYNTVFVPSKNFRIPLDTVFQIPGNKYHGFGYEKQPVNRMETFRADK